jgi:hypothetical protein
MRVLRSIAAVLIWLVASLLLVVSIVLCVTILLLPVGILLGLLSLRLYVMGFGLLLPRSRDIQKGVRKQARRWWRKSSLPDLSPKRVRRRARKIMRLGR